MTRHNDHGADLVAKRNTEAVVDLTTRRKKFRRPRRDEPDERIQRVRSDLEPLARWVSESESHVYEELSSIGHSGSFSRDRVSGGSASSSPTAEDAMRASELKEWREDMRDAKSNLERVVRDLRGLAGRHRTASLPAFSVAKLCKERQMELEGYEVWGNPHCNELGVTADLCGADYQACRRFRQSTGLPPIGDKAKAG